jgi:hypothetical protein
MNKYDAKEQLTELNLPQRMISSFSNTRGKYRISNFLNKYGWTAVPNVKEFSIRTND